MKAAFLLVAIVLFSSCFYNVQAQSEGCQICETVVGTIESWVDSNATEAEIQTYLQSLCNNVPAYSAVCTVVVDYGLEYVIAYLQADGSPDTLCTLLTFCSTKVAEAQVSDGTECFVCTQAIGTIESWLESGASQQEVETLFNQVCVLVPAWQPQCQAIIAAGWPAVMQWIATNENATTVCQQVDFCTASKGCSKMPQNIGNGLECESCQVIVNSIEGWAARNSSETEIENWLMGIFCKVGGSFTATCDAAIEYGIPAFINWVVANENGPVVCQQLNICPVPSMEILHKTKTFSHVKIN